MSKIQNIVSLYGDVRSFQMESDEWPLTILVEYYDTRCAAHAKAVLEDMYNKVSTTTLLDGMMVVHF